MPCTGDGTTGLMAPMWAFENWSRTRRHVVPMRCQPTTVTQLVAAVQAAENASSVAKAVGSGWSYTDVAIGPDVRIGIDTDLLSMSLAIEPTTSYRSR